MENTPRIILVQVNLADSIHPSIINDITQLLLIINHVQCQVCQLSRHLRQVYKDYKEGLRGFHIL